MTDLKIQAVERSGYQFHHDPIPQPLQVAGEASLNCVLLALIEVGRAEILAAPLTCEQMVGDRQGHFHAAAVPKAA